MKLLKKPRRKMQPYTGMIDADKPNYGPLLIILAGCFWGSMGILVRKLGLYGFTSVQIVSIRLTLAAIVFCIMLLIKDPSGFLISFRDIPLFFGLGVGSDRCGFLKTRDDGITIRLLDQHRRAYQGLIKIQLDIQGELN